MAASSSRWFAPPSSLARPQRRAPSPRTSFDFQLAFRLQLREALRASLSPPTSESPQQNDPPSTHSTSLGRGCRSHGVLQPSVRAAAIRSCGYETDAVRSHDYIRSGFRDDVLARDAIQLELQRLNACKNYFLLFLKVLVNEKSERLIIVDCCGQLLVDVFRPVPSHLMSSTEYLALLEDLKSPKETSFRFMRAISEDERLCEQILEGLGRGEQVSDLIDTLSKDFELIVLDNYAPDMQDIGQASSSPKAADKARSLEPAQLPTKRCSICLEYRKSDVMLKIDDCLHEFCGECLSQYATSRIEDRRMPIVCPQQHCRSTLTASQCEMLLPKDTYELLTTIMAEAQISDATRLYCPFPTCSALMVREELQAKRRTSTTRSIKNCVGNQAECPECHRLFCLECRVPWHSGMTCFTYKRLPVNERSPEDLKFQRLAKSQKWQRCKKCGSMIELVHGCNHMKCRCGCEFCYVCGAVWRNRKQTCTCKLFHERHILLWP